MNKKITAFAVMGEVWAVFWEFVCHSMPWGHFRRNSGQSFLLLQLGNTAEEAHKSKIFGSGGVMHLHDFVYHSMPCGHSRRNSGQSLLLLQLGKLTHEAKTPKMAKHTSLPRWKYRGTRLLSLLRPFCHFFVRCLGKADEVMRVRGVRFRQWIAGFGRGLNLTVLVIGNAVHQHDFVYYSMPWGHQTLEGQSMQSLLLFQLGKLTHKADTPKMAKYTSLPRWKYRGTRLSSLLRPFCRFFVRCLGKADEVMRVRGVRFRQWITFLGSGLNSKSFLTAFFMTRLKIVYHSMVWGHSRRNSGQSLLLLQLGNSAHEAGIPKMAKHASLPRRKYRGTVLLSLLRPFCHFFVRCLGKAGEGTRVRGWDVRLWIAGLGSGLNPVCVLWKFGFQLVMVWVLMLIGFSLRAQEVVALKIGDRVPKSFWKQDHEVLERGNFVKQKMEVYKGKALILDFWGTYCVPCINAFPKFESLQEQFKGQLQFLAVNSQRKEMVSKFFEDRNALSFPVVANDAYLHKLFPHRLIPNEVWIDAGGIVRAFTNGESLDSTRLRKFLGGSGLDAVMKYDQDLSKPLFFSEALPIAQLQSYSVFIKGHVEGTGASFQELETEHGVGVTLTNTPIIFMLSHIGNKLIPHFSYKLLLMNRQDSSVLYLGGRKGVVRKAWYQEQEVSVNLLVPKRDSALLYLRLIHFLDENSYYQIGLQQEKRECLILKLKDGYKPNKGKGLSENTLQNTGEKYLRNGRMHFFVAWFNEAYENMPVMIDETHLNYPIDLELEEGFNDLRQLKEILLKQGYILEQGTRKLDVIAVKHK